MNLIAKSSQMFIIAKSSQMFSSDEMGIAIVHKPSKVVTHIGRCNGPSLTSVDKGKSPMIPAFLLVAKNPPPQFMLYPRKQPAASP